MTDKQNTSASNANDAEFVDKNNVGAAVEIDNTVDAPVEPVKSDVEKNAGTFVEVGGKVGGPEESMKREDEMAAEVAKNDPQDANGPGMNMQPDHDIATTYHYYKEDVTDPSRPEDGLTHHTVNPEAAAAESVRANAMADDLRKQASEAPSLVNPYADAATISAMEDAERIFEDLSTQNLQGETYARNIILSGSTSFAPLMQALVDGFEQKFGMWKNVHPSLPMAKITITVDPVGTSAGLKKVLDGEADFLMASCPIPRETYEKFGEFREAFEVANQILAIGVQATNELVVDKLGGLTRLDYRRIFSGEAAQWSSVDERLPQENVDIYVGDADDGMAAVFDSVIMMGTKVSPTATALPAARDLAPAIAKDEWAIGYAPLQDINAMNAETYQVATLTVDGIEPGPETVASGRYPLVQPLMLLTPKRADPFIRVFLQYVYGQDGYNIIKARGYCPSFKPGDTKQIYVTEAM